MFYNKVLLTFIFLSIMISYSFSKEYRDEALKFGFNYNGDYAEIGGYEGPNDKINIVIGFHIREIEDFPTEFPYGINLKDNIIKTKQHLESGKIVPEDYDFFDAEVNVKKRNGKYFIYKIEYKDDGDWLEEDFITNIMGTFIFFVDEFYVEISVYFKKNFPDMILNKSEGLYSTYFKPYIKGYGAEFVNKKSGKNLLDEIKSKNKQLPEDLILWYDTVTEVYETLYIK